MASAATRTNMPHDLATLVLELMEMINELSDSITDVKTHFDAHTHNGDGAQAGSYFTSPPRTNAATVSVGTARVLAAAPTKITH